MKRALALLLAMMMLVGLINVTAFATGDVAFRVDTSGITEAVNPGETISVPINITTNPGVTMINFDVDYSSDVFENVSIVGNTSFGGSFTSNGTKTSWEADDLGVDVTATGLFATVSLTVKADATGTATIGLKGSITADLDITNADYGSVGYTVSSGTITVYTAPTGVQFKNGSQTFTYEEIKADNYSLTAPGADYYFAGWYKDVTEVADKLVFENNRYILSDKDITDGDSFTAKELRPKYDSKPSGDMIYYAIWVHDNDTSHMSAMVLEPTSTSLTGFKYRKENFDEVENEANSNTTVINKAVADAWDGRKFIKIIKDMGVTQVIGNAIKRSDMGLDLNGHTLTGTIDNTPVVYTNYSTNYLISSHGQGKLVRTVGKTGEYSANEVLECRTGMAEIRDVDIEAMLDENQRATGIYISQATVGLVENVNIKLSGSLNLQGILLSGAAKIDRMSNSNINLVGGADFMGISELRRSYFIKLGDANAYAKNITGTTMTANTAGIIGEIGSVTFGAGNSIATASTNLIVDCNVGFNSTENVMTVATGGHVFADGVIVTENPGSMIANGSGDTLAFEQGFSIVFKSYDGSQTLYTDSYAYGSTPVDHSVSYPVVGVMTYNHVGWTLEQGSTVLTDPATITDNATLYAVREEFTLPTVATVECQGTITDFPSYDAAIEYLTVDNWAQPITIQLQSDATGTQRIKGGYWGLTLDLNGYTLTYSNNSYSLYEFGGNNTTPADSSMHITFVDTTDFILTSTRGMGTIELTSSSQGLVNNSPGFNGIIPDITISNVIVNAPNLAANTVNTRLGAVISNRNQASTMNGTIILNNVEINAANAAALEFSIMSTNSACGYTVNIINSRLSGGTVAIASKGSGNIGPSHVSLTVDADSTFKGAADTYPIQEINGNFGLTPNYPAGYALTAGADGWYSFVPALNYNDGAAQAETGLDPVITETTVDELTVSNAETLGNFNSLTVTNDNATVVFSAEALDSIAATATGDVVLKIKEATANANASKTLSLTVEQGGNPVDFSGEVTVTVPAPDTSKSYEVFYNDGSSLTAMNAVREGDNLVFTTTHFSDYDVIEQYSFTGISMSGMTETTTGVTGGKVYKGTEVTAEYTYSGASNVETITASVAGGESFTATESGGVWTVTIPADKVVGDITVTASMSDPVFDIYYVCTGTDSDSDNFYETTPGGTISFDVYVKSDKTKNLQAFDIYPVWDGMLTYDSITPVSGISITTEAMDAAHPHFQSVSTALNLEVGSAGVKIATINFTLSADAVYEEHYPVYFSDLSNLAIGLTPQSTLIGNMDTTGTMGAETVTKVNVSFNANGGEGTMADQEVGYNKATALNENTFTREGYTFTGWNTAADGSGTAYADKADITTKAAVELFAQWEIKTYTITWENDDGTVLATDTVNHGETPSYTGATPTKTEDAQYSYTFSGWTPVISAATGDVTYTATYTQTARTYTITLVANGGEYASGYTAPTGYSYGDTVALPTDAEISKAGYIFGGWYEASDFSGSAVTAVSATDTGDKTFYAKWTAEEYTIIFKDGDTVLETKQYDTESTGDIKSLYDDPTKEGYTFSTWQVSVTGGNWPAVGTSVGSSTALAGKTGNVTLNALWSTDTYTITYNLDGGTVALSNPTTYSVTTDTFTLNNPTKEGHTFLGWSGTGLTGTDNLTVTIAIGSTGNREYTANWQINQYTISFDSDDGSPVDPITGDYGDPVTPPDEPTKPGYEFGGWDPTLPGTIPSEDITVTATWTPITYTVTFNGNGSTSGSMDPETFTYDVKQALTANAFAKTGNTFLGWAESAGGTVVYTDGQSVKNLRDTNNANVDLFAVWQANTYTVTFVDENDNVVSEVDFTYGDSSVSEPTVPEKPGYNGTWESYTLADSDIAVHPEYTVITYTITYVLDGGTNPDGAVTSYNIESTDTLPTPTKDLSVFGGWKISYATGESGNWTADAVVNAGTAVTGYYGNVTLTAQWTADFSYVVENYKYATDEYVMLRIADELGDSSKVYTFDGAAMYYTTDSTYLVNVGDSGVFFTLIPAATYTDTTTLTSAGVEKLSVEDGARADVVRDGDVNGTAPVNIADANAVYQMVQNGGSYYTIDQLVNALRLGADMARENWNSTDHRGTLADVNVIVNMINDAANN